MLADERIRQIAYKGGVRTNVIGDKKTKANSSSSEPEVEGALDYLVRVGIKDNSIKRTEKSKSTDPKPARNTPVKPRKEATKAKETPSKESIKLPDDNLEPGTELPNAKRTRKPTNRHSPSEANRQVQVLRKRDNRPPIPDLPERESIYEVV